ncbi:hypothetical protein [Motiliproteus sp. MSK22-1]|uniref:hypothetical protein n=1 Tax=Motiliproteus sp. MSK22-1 TaxID=1897630 RepID=UPI0009757897|nr:hypothetical protein [Motiliproteus sp. MSK22-1]OMH39633.1 hypothetical protein BGP75_01995 [Motiliproteus sp. MSK22-1]
MLEINDRCRLVKHSGQETQYWVAQQLLLEETSHRRDIWKPISLLLTTSQAESWLAEYDAPQGTVMRFKEVAGNS